MRKPLTELETAQVVALTERIKAKAAAEFFSDPGLPEELQKDLREGWEVLEERRRERARAGAPLLPGGCLVLGDSSVLAQSMADFHNRLADSLGVGVEAVRLRREGTRILADVALPDGWPRDTPGEVRAAVLTHHLVGTTVGIGGEFFSGELKLDQKTIEHYIRGLVGELNELYRSELIERLTAVRTVRAELVPRTWVADEDDDR